MDKTLIIDLKKKIFLRSALIPIDGLNDLLDLNDTFSADEIQKRCAAALSASIKP